MAAALQVDPKFLTQLKKKSILEIEKQKIVPPQKKKIKKKKSNQQVYCCNSHFIPTDPWKC